MRRIGGIAAAAASIAALGTAGCGGQAQDANEPSGRFPVEITHVSFPASQHLAEPVRMVVVVRNAGIKTIPNLAITITKAGASHPTEAAAFASTSEQSGLASTSRPNWVVDQGPVGGDTAYSNTWAAGPLRRGRRRRFVWSLTPVNAGHYEIAYRVAAGLNGKARAVLRGGGIPEGTVTVDVNDKPAQTRVDDNGNVVTVPK